MTTVSIILPTKNVENNIGDLLRSVYRQDFSGEIETIVLDSSDDKTPEIAKSFPVKFIHVEEDDYNYGGTRNYGASLAKGNYLIFLSADVVIKDTEWLTKLLNPFKDSKVAGVFGRQHPKKTQVLWRIFLFNMLIHRRVMYWHRMPTVRFISKIGCFSLIRTPPYEKTFGKT